MEETIVSLGHYKINWPLKGGKVVICGGGEIESGAYPVCFSLNQTVQWNFQAVMKSDRMGAASAAISGRTRLWVIGKEFYRSGDLELSDINLWTLKVGYLKLQGICMKQVLIWISRRF